MATGEGILWFAARTDPAANPPTFGTTASAAAATTNAFQLRWDYLEYHASTDQATSWQLMVPAGYISGITVAVKWYSPVATSGSVVWKFSTYAAVDSSSDLDTSSVFNAVDVSSAIAVPGTVGHTKITSQALTNPGWLATNFAVLMVGRDADHASDTSTGVARIIAVNATFTS